VTPLYDKPSVNYYLIDTNTGQATTPAALSYSFTFSLAFSDAVSCFLVFLRSANTKLRQLDKRVTTGCEIVTDERTAVQLVDLVIQ